MEDSLEIRTTRDGSRTLYSHAFRQSFHSMHGALTEASHVFLEGAKLSELFQSRKEMSILEVGFGAGLNWLLTASLALRHQVSLTYTGLDLQIPNADLLSRLSYGELIETPPLAQHLIQWRGTFDGAVPSGTYHLPHDGGSILQLHIGEATTANLSPNAYDCVYLDAFDPKSNPILWTLEFIQQLHDTLCGGGCLATYSAAGRVRRALVTSGFSVMRRPGPPGKREVLVARKPCPADP